MVLKFLLTEYKALSICTLFKGKQYEAGLTANILPHLFAANILPDLFAILGVVCGADKISAKSGMRRDVTPPDKDAEVSA